jgi:hypothetical protein
MQRWFALIAALVVACATAVAPAAAQAPAGEPPLIAGRVALAEGDAQIWRVEDEGNAGQWDGAVVNDVVTVGTGLFTGADGRNEIRIGPNSFRLGAGSRGGFSQLDYTAAVFNLEYGTLNARLASPEHGETVAVTVSGVRVDLVAPGRYRIDATEGGPMRLTVFEGYGTVRSAARSFGVGGSQAAVVNPNGDGVSFEQPVATAFDQWALARDDQYRQVRSAQYVSPYMTGYETLDAYGQWSTDATYGVVWYPSAVPVGWAPYRYGQWRWVRPWGWTWVDYAPWGYAPFHYGRWVMVGARWCWVPGGYVRRPVWAPALVGFVGSGASVSVSVGAPLVGWYPLAPWNRYEPHYRHSPNYVTVINQTVINRVPPNAPRDGAHSPGATMVPGPRFRDPIPKVAVTTPQRPQDLRPSGPPPLNVAPAPRPSVHKFSDADARPSVPASPGAPTARGQRDAPPPQSHQSPAPQAQPQQPAPSPASPPTRVRPPMAVEPMPNRGVTPQPPMPGNDPVPMNQPPGLKRAPPVPAPQPAVPTPRPSERPAPRPHLPSDQIPLSQPQPVNPAEPARVPPGAPPTIRQAPPPGMAGGARPVQPSPPPAPQAVPMPAVPRPAVPAAVPAPAVAPGAAAGAPPGRPHPAPAAKEQVLRGDGNAEHGRPEREAPAPRAKQADR